MSLETPQEIPSTHLQQTRPAGVHEASTRELGEHAFQVRLELWQTAHVLWAFIQVEPGPHRILRPLIAVPAPGDGACPQRVVEYRFRHGSGDDVAPAGGNAPCDIADGSVEDEAIGGHEGVQNGVDAVGRGRLEHLIGSARQRARIRGGNEKTTFPPIAFDERGFGT